MHEEKAARHVVTASIRARIASLPSTGSPPVAAARADPLKNGVWRVETQEGIINRSLRIIQIRQRRRF